MGSHTRILESRKKGGGIKLAVAVLDALEFDVVVTATVTVSAGLTLELELATNGFRGSLVLIAQLAFGALVLQEK
jgi:hypothetical protein